MGSIEAVAVSFRPGQIRLSDVARQVGDARKFTVRVLDATGIEREVHVELTTKWCGAWRWELQCHRCHGPARVLHIAPDAALCGRCSPLLTAYQRHKRAGSWPTEGAIAEKLIRTSLAASTPRARKLIQHLKRNTLTRVTHLIERAAVAVRAADELLKEKR